MKTLRCIALIVCGFVTSLNAFSQKVILHQNDIVYVNPNPASVYNNPKTTITIRFSDAISQETLRECSLTLKSKNNEKVSGKLVFPKSGHIVIFKPDNKLQPWQDYQVDILHKGGIVKSFRFSTSKSLRAKQTDFDNLWNIQEFDNRFVDKAKANRFREEYSLPDDFPAIEIVSSNNPGEGYYILNRMTQSPLVTRYLLIMDTLGFPIYYQAIDSTKRTSNMALQPTGYLTYWDDTDTLYYEMDSSYNIINEYSAKNGYAADGHELRLLNDGSYWLMIYDLQIVDMSEIVPGGQEGVYVKGLIIQHIDIEANVLFQWSSWDHFEITDVDPNFADLTSLGFDYVHGNALDFDADSNILLSSRHLDEITNINAIRAK